MFRKQHTLLKEQIVGSRTPATAITMMKSSYIILLIFFHKMEHALYFLWVRFKPGNFLVLYQSNKIINPWMEHYHNTNNGFHNTNEDTLPLKTGLYQQHSHKVISTSQSIHTKVTENLSLYFCPFFLVCRDFNLYLYLGGRPLPVILKL